ncbi:transposase [Carbonactinospora thermoautotrophica]|uniref:transposase n=1 Tax=Carbonactinospora thermoautotrophica TaxID=1469144 RepID=UPI000832CA31|nr:transposase [Carbonactinospora thermoautotrophica]
MLSLLEERRANLAAARTRLVNQLHALLRDLVSEIRGLDAHLARVAKRMSATPAEHGSRLLKVDGVGPVLAARILGRVGAATRFPTAAALAGYAGVAPIEVASGERRRRITARTLPSAA